MDYDAYKPIGDVSTDMEDYNPSEPYDPGLFNVTVGCAECHAYPYEEYKASPHGENERGVEPGCMGCHNAHSVREILMWKFFYVNQGGLGETPFHAISSTLRDIPAWEDLRIELAKRVREEMVAEDSVKCKNCHKPKSKWFNKIERHQENIKTLKKTCVECHYNIVHKSVKWHEDDTRGMKK
ncbi:MAG: NapC/NirT family cytochrome c [Magnetococcales bacterium]|nr:NapC/NirT family cytochrome c [Magnetococcales bacterium]